VQVLLDVHAVHHAYDPVEAKFVVQNIVRPQGRDDGPRVGQAGGFNEDVVEAISVGDELLERGDQVVLDGAAYLSSRYGCC
jgi:hypothetical protein